MPITKLCNRNGSGYVALPKDDLRLDGLLDDDGEIQDDTELYVQRAGDGTFIVRVVENGEIPDLEDCDVIKRAAAGLVYEQEN